MMGSSNSGDTGLAGLAALLKVAADPTAASSWLQKVTEKSEEAAQFVDQAKQINIKTDALNKEIEKKKADIEQALQKQAAKEAELSAREAKYRADRDKLVTENETHLKTVEAFKQLREQVEADLDKRTKAVIASEEAHKAKVQAALDDLVAQNEQLKNEHAAALAGVENLKSSIAHLHNEAKAQHEEAMRFRKMHEGRIADLREFLKKVSP